MSEESKTDKEKKPTTETTGQPVTPTTPTTAPESEKKDVTITVKHEFETKKPADVPPVETPKPAEKPAETSKTETSTETPKEKELREKLEERETQLGLIATKAFDEEKTAFLDQIKDPEKRADAERRIGDDPEKLTSAQFIASIISAGIKQAGGEVKGLPEGGKPAETPKTSEKPEDDGTEKVPPAGVAKAPPVVPTGNVTTQVIDELFNILMDPQKSQREKDSANQKINEMYGEFRRGAKESGKKDSYPLPPTMDCPKCHSIMQGNICQTCGYEIPKMQR